MTYMWLYGSRYLFRAVHSTKLPGGSIVCIVHMALFIHYFVLVKVNFSSIKFLIMTCIVTN